MGNERWETTDEFFPNEESRKKWANNLKKAGTVVGIPAGSTAVIVEVVEIFGWLNRSAGINAIENSGIIVGLLGLLLYASGKIVERPHIQ